ncbi:membrane protein [Microbacterium phage Zooman]|nr:membrane protein [Microbacterium phage Zooman]
MKNKVAATVAGTLLAILAFTGCSSATYDNPADERSEKQNEVTLDNSLGIEAQKERLSREEDTSAIRYVYLINYGEIFGYYTIKGGVYGADTQLAPEQEIACPWNRTTTCNTVDSEKDNGTYGGGDTGVFFVTSDDVLVETTLDYIQADAPIAVYANVPQLNTGE